MTIIRFALRAIVLSIFTVALTMVAQAQAVLTWVSGVGDDANPCSRIAPCKTFAGAQSKTIPGGQINVLDPGSYGVVTIVKTLSIDSPPGMAVIIPTPFSNAVNINIPADSAPRFASLRNITINGLGPSVGVHGVSILSANAVYISDVVITNFAGRGISDTRTSGELFVKDTITRNNGEVGIRIGPNSGSTSLAANLNRVTSEGNAYHGVAAFGGARVTIEDSFLTGNDNSGLVVESSAGSTKVVVENTNLSNNTDNGVFSGPGSSQTYIGRSIISNNTTGVNVFSGTVYTW